MKQNITLLAAFFFTLANYAQLSNDSKSQQTPSPTPSRIKVYTPNTSFSSKSSDKKDNSYRWTAKTDVVAMLTGEFPIIGEYRFAPKFSVEGSAAVTYAFYSNDGIFGNDTYGGTFLDDSGKAGVGNAFRGTIKYYPSSDYDALEGWAFGIQFYTKTTNRIYDSNDINYGVNNSPSTTYTDSKVKNGISLIISNQTFVDSNVSLEYFFGIGLANTTRDQPLIADNGDIQMSKTTEQGPNFQFGTRIGFGN